MRGLRSLLRKSACLLLALSCPFNLKRKSAKSMSDFPQRWNCYSSKLPHKRGCGCRGKGSTMVCFLQWFVFCNGLFSAYIGFSRPCTYVVDLLSALSKPPHPRWARSRRPRAPPGSPTRSTTFFSTLETTFSLRNMWETGLKTRCWTIFTFFSGNCPPLWPHLPMTAWIRRQAMACHGQIQHSFPHTYQVDAIKGW